MPAFAECSAHEVFLKTGLKIEIKGEYNWQSYSSQKKQFMTDFFLQLLFDPKYRKSKQSIHDLLARTNRQLLETDFPLHKMTYPMIEKYSTFIRLSDKDPQSLYLQRVYNCKEGCWVLPTDEDIEIGLQHVIPI